MYNNYDKFLKQENPRKHFKNQSFSSVLLDQVFNSMDQDNLVLNSSQRKNLNNPKCNSFSNNDFMSFSTSSSSSSSDFSFSSGNSFSSEAEYSSGMSKSSKHNKAATNGIAQHLFHSNPQVSSKKDEDLMMKSKSRSRAMQIYSNWKKMKQPVSPGGRFARLINSLFSSENSKKMESKLNGVDKSGLFNDGELERNVKCTNATFSCSSDSSTSSFPRSCLSKKSAMNSKAKIDHGKRSVRFYPVSTIILDDDSYICGHKSRNVESYDDEDGFSDCSEDLFEIDHLGLFGNDRFCDELPVYGTTHVNRRIIR